jgi:hypothetical protein
MLQSVRVIIMYCSVYLYCAVGMSRGTMAPGRISTVMQRLCFLQVRLGSGKREATGPGPAILGSISGYPSRGPAMAAHHGHGTRKYLGRSVT